MKTILFAAAIAAIATPAIARNDDPVFVESAAVKDKPTVALDPTKAYVLLRSEVQTPMYLMKLPTSEDQAAYDRMRAEALVKAHGKYEKKLANYERDLKAAEKAPGYRVGDKPVEPTEANFEFTPFALMAAVGIGPINRFAKQGGSTYLHEVTPGTYRVYGFLSAAPGVAAMGSCFCMGSVKFDARAGEITDLGVIEKAEPVDRPDGDSSYPMVMTGQKLFVPAGADTPMDPRLASAKIVPATFRAAGKMPNYFGLTITRVPDMPGVLRYDRDRIVDLAAAR
ncbi:hypothetical protein M9980_03265 [Sphingomonas donggukensis]|uniref:Uncharacterized protein n=1 Tax=Sphingomonas donggukensis TaxID=2949093 RepID=A0ABY4TV40_9SPHN|nr:hypothetical protein [Sphingomonas donggukensis]URW76260.1 hypothetical protein M9980_03265 [Sphingomonas donggukensis]